MVRLSFLLGIAISYVIGRLVINEIGTMINQERAHRRWKILACSAGIIAILIFIVQLFG